MKITIKATDIVLVDRLWPRGMKKEALNYDLWEKDIAPSTELREWFHIDPENRWNEFNLYTKKIWNILKAPTNLLGKWKNILLSHLYMLQKMKSIPMP